MKRRTAQEYVGQALRIVTPLVQRLDPSTDSLPQHASRYLRKTKKRTYQEVVEHDGMSEVEEVVDAYGMTKADYKFCLEWMRQHAMPEGGRNATIGSFIEECLEMQFQKKTKWTRREAEDVLKNKLKMKYGKVYGGYYFKKAHFPETIAHRGHFLQLVKAFEQSNKFVVLYCDESQFRVNALPRRAWYEESRKESRVDERTKQGVGHGYGVSGFLYHAKGCAPERGVLKDGERFVGHMVSTMSKKNDTTDSFLDALQSAIEVSKKKWPERQIVIVADGSRPHTGKDASFVSVTSKTPLGPTKNSPGYKSMLEELNLEFDGTKDGAKTVFLESQYNWRQRCRAEAFCENLEVCLLYLPNSHPLLNPIKHLWRFIKMKWRHGVVDNKDMESLFNSVNDGMSADWENDPDLQVHINKWFTLAHRYALYFDHLDQKSKELAPSEAVMLGKRKWPELQKKLKIQDGEFKCPIGRSIFGDLRDEDTSPVDFKVVFEACKWVNSARIAQCNLEGKHLPSVRSLGALEKFEVLTCIANTVQKYMVGRTGRREDERDKREGGTGEVGRGKKGRQGAKSKEPAKKRSATAKRKRQKEKCSDLDDFVGSEEERLLPPKKSKRGKKDDIDVLPEDDLQYVPDPDLKMILEEVGSGDLRCPKFMMPDERSFRRLSKKGVWVDDEAVNGQIALLRPFLPDDTAVFSSFICSHSMGTATFRANFVKSQLLGRDSMISKLIFPIHEGSHWYVCRVRVLDRVLEFYDSLEKTSKRRPCFSTITKFLDAVLPRQEGFTKWEQKEMPNLSKQQNGTECGVYTIARIRGLIAQMDRFGSLVHITQRHFRTIQGKRLSL